VNSKYNITVKAIVLIVLAIFVLPALVAAQYFAVNSYTAQNGLCHSNIFRIYQDKRGFLWFCTAYGLSRYDGKKFNNYYDTDGLAGNSILSIEEDDLGNKYVSVLDRGISLVSNTDRTSKTITFSLPTTVVSEASYKGKIWMVGYDTSHHLFQVCENKPSEVQICNNKREKVKVNKIIKTNDELFFATDDGLFKIDSSGNITSIFNNVIREKVYDFQIDKRGSYWIATSDRIIHTSQAGMTKVFQLKDKTGVSDLLIDTDNNLWAAVPGEGVLLIRNDSAENITTRLKIASTIINDIYEDSEHNIWIATHGMGAYKISTLYATSYPLEKSKINNYIKAISSYDERKTIVASIGTVSLWEKHQLQPLSFNGLNSVMYIYFAERINDNLYLGTPFGLLNKNLKTGKEILMQTPENSGFISFCKDQKGTIWLGSYYRLYKMRNGKIYNVDDTALLGQRYNSICEGNDNEIIFGTNKGLIYHKKGHYVKQSFEGNSINKVNQVFCDSKCGLWFATDSGLIHRSENSSIIINTGKGLPHNRCNAITEDTVNKVLWIGTLNGVCSIDLTTLLVRKYPLDVKEEVLSILYKKDMLFVGTVNGMYTVKIGESNLKVLPPQLYITEVRCKDFRISMPTSVTIKEKEKIALSFIGISYSNPEKVRYKYKIEGLDNTWNYTSESNIELSSLPAGDFRFLLSAQQNNSNWSDVISLSLQVTAPFWKSFWFKCLIVLLTSLIIFLTTKKVILIQEYKKRSKFAIYNKITYLKQQAFRALINPHFIFNSMTSIQHYLHRNNNEKASNYLADFAKLIRTTLDDAQESFINLKKEISRIELYLSLEQSRFGDDLSYIINISPELNIDNIWIPNMILQPYIENAIWHGIMPKEAKGLITISISENDADTIQITITDDGIGLEESQKLKKKPSSHYGTQLTETRLALLEKILNKPFRVATTEVKSGGVVKGSEVKIIFPLQNLNEVLNHLEELMNAE